MWALVSARAEGISIRNPGHGGRAVALPGAPARSGAGADALDAALGELRAAGWPAPEDPDSDEDAELEARTGHFTLAVIRDGAGPDPAAWKRYLEETLGSSFEVGLKLNASSDAPPGDLRRRLDEASRLLDGIVNEIYAAMFRAYRPRA